jgi:DNA-binding transcriptional LysR family regulator
MIKFDFVTLKIFITISEVGSLSSAAEREHIAIAAISKRISDLEATAGTKLLYRRSRGVELTPAGHAFLHHARKILDDVFKLDAELSEYELGIKGHIRLHSNTSSIIAFLPQDLSSFSRKYPHIKIDLQERTSAEIISAVRDGMADIGVFAGHVNTHDLQIIPYKYDRLVLVVPQDHPVARYKSVCFNDINSLDFIGLQQNTSLHSLLYDQANKKGKILKMRIQVRSFDAICRMIHHGMGVGILPEKTIYEELKELKLKTLPLTDRWARIELVVGIRNYDTLSVTAKFFIDHLTFPKKYLHKT